MQIAQSQIFLRGTPITIDHERICSEIGADLSLANLAATSVKGIDHPVTGKNNPNPQLVKRKHKAAIARSQFEASVSKKAKGIDVGIGPAAGNSGSEGGGTCLFESKSQAEGARTCRAHSKTGSG
jgi:hypothetical protein